MSEWHILHLGCNADTLLVFCAGAAGLAVHVCVCMATCFAAMHGELC
jgi:hypothetical protein